MRNINPRRSLPSIPLGFAYTFTSEAVEALDQHILNQCNVLMTLRQLFCFSLFHASNLIFTEELFHL